MRSLIFLLLTFSLNTQAALIEFDFEQTEDKGITQDTNTNYQWLDLSYTKGLSYNYVNSQTQSGGEFEGFRIANQQELNSLWSNQGFSYAFYGEQSSYQNESEQNSLFNFMEKKNYNFLHNKYFCSWIHHLLLITSKFI